VLFYFAISAFKYNPFATKLKACSVVKMPPQVWQNALKSEVQAKAKETGDNLNMINQT
jgi:hypothetical protein